MLRFLALLILVLSCKSEPPTRPLVRKAKASQSENLNEQGNRPTRPDPDPSPAVDPTPEPDPSEPDPMQPDPGTPNTPDPVAPEPIVTTPTVPDPLIKDPVVPVPEPMKPELVLENGHYTIQNLGSKKCLEITSANTGTAIVQFGCNGAGIQAFKIETLAKGEYKIFNLETRKSLDIKGASKADGGVLDQDDFANGENQTFLISHDKTVDGAVTIRAKHSMKYLEIPDASPRSKVQARQMAESNKDQQRWKLTRISEPQKAPGVRYTFVNECDHDVWVASQNNPGYPVVKGDFKLPPGGYNKADTDAKWEGRFWGRYNCKMVNGKLSCESGQCAKGEICGDVHGEPPVAIAEFRTRGYEDIDFYDISLVDGTNLPMDIRPMPLTLKADGAKGSCKHLECKADLRLDCPAVLQKKNAAGKVIGCNSACEVFKTDEHCCLGRFATTACRPTSYSMFFHERCPDAYSFAEDTKTFTCRNADYEVIFCPK